MSTEQIIAFHRDAMSGGLTVQGSDKDADKVVAFAKDVCSGCVCFKNGSCEGVDSIDDDLEMLLDARGRQITAKPCSLVGTSIE